MARWDEILSLPVQNPPTLEFSSDDLVWTKVEGWRDNIDRVALIPFARVDDFVRGESSNKDCPTRFHVEARRRRPPEMTYKPKVDGILEYILYWCSFGPDDHRKGGIVRPSRSTYVPKKKSAGRPNTKRGCTCHFIVKRLIAEPSVALVIYNQDKHVDKKGLPCHGPQDKKAAGTRAMYAPYISEDLRLRVLSLLYVGVSVETIMQRHNESVERQGGPSNRDDLLTHRYVRRQERSIRRSTYELDADDAVSLSMWVESHQNHVFFYEDFSDSNPFVLGIQTEWQLQQMIRFGYHSLVASDSRFGTNKLKYPVHSLVVFNSDNKAIPVAWIIAPRFACGDTHRWMRALYNRVHTKDPMWKLAGFIVDDPLADILTIREIFQCSVLISFWRVRHAWHRNVIKRCSEIMRAEISRQLGQIVHSICKGHGTVDLFQDFMVDFIDESEFMDYFKAIWSPRMELWTSALKGLPLASQETSAAMEFYHNQMKLRLLNEKDPSVYQRADWLVDKLGTKVHSYFWLDEYSEKDDFARYQKDEWMNGLTSWRKSLKIPDSDVVMEGKRAKVLDQDDRNKAHVVFNPGSEFGICDCIWAEKGNLCEHVLKIIKVFRLKGFNSPSISMFQYNQALINMLHCPPHDSLIRDHAVSLAVWVQNQLNTLVDVESTQTIVDSGGQLTVGPLGANQEKDKISETHCTNKSISSNAKNGSTVGQIALDCITGDLVSNLFDQLASENGICGERNGADISSAEMEVDPASICTSSSGLFSVDGVAPTNLFTENGERMLVDAGPDITKNLPSTDDSFTNLNVFEDDILDKDSCESAMDMESEITPILPKINSKPISDTQLVNMVETAGGRGIGVHNGDGSMSQNLLSVDDDVLLVGIQDSVAKDYSNCCNAEKVNFDAPVVPSEKPGMCHLIDHGDTSQNVTPLADVMPLAVQNRIADSDLGNNTKEANFRCKTDDTSASLSISASIDSQLANMVEAVGEIEENREMCPLTENGSSTQIPSSVDDEIPVTGSNEPENSNPFDTRGCGNVLSVSQESSQDPSNSSSDKLHLPVDPAKQETSTYVEPSSSIEPLPVKLGTSDQIAVGKFPSEMIRQQ